MDTQHISESIQKATTEVFSTMMGLEVEARAAHADDCCPSANDGVMAFVGIAGPWVGNGILSCSADLACKLSSRFLMSDGTLPMSEEVLDSIGEMANMVIGNFKTDAEAHVGPLVLGVPTIVYGRNFTPRNLGKKSWLVMPFQCDAEPFEVRIWFAPSSQSKPV
jgi:chemotaxis protein CheX